MKFKSFQLDVLGNPSCNNTIEIVLTDEPVLDSTYEVLHFVIIFYGQVYFFWFLHWCLAGLFHVGTRFNGHQISWIAVKFYKLCKMWILSGYLKNICQNSHISGLYYIYSNCFFGD